MARSQVQEKVKATSGESCGVGERGVCVENKLERLFQAISQKSHDSGLDPLNLGTLIQRDKGSCLKCLNSVTKN